jgi:hypothetical protein
MKAVRISLGLVVFLSIIVVECATLFVLFVPVVPETANVPCYANPCPQGPFVSNYYGSVSFHYFNVGMVFGACNDFQMVTSASRSPTFCMTP